MRKETGAEKSAARARRALFASGAFYALVAFEFFYMASPFGAYLYAVYGPGLDWLEASGSTSWLIQFFLPHLVEETSSVLIDVHELPLAEVHVDLATGTVSATYPPPADPFYGTRQVPLF